MKIYMVTFPTDDPLIDKGDGKGFCYFATKGAAKQWMEEETPCPKYDISELTEVDIKPTAKAVASYMNGHHAYW